MADEFDRYHPLVNMTFFLSVLLITMFQMQIVMSLISMGCGILYFIYLKREKSVSLLALAFFVMVISSIINPLFSHKGRTLVAYLFTGNPVTLESIVYGLMAAVIIAATIIWFGSFNIIIKSDKIVALIGKISPHISLLITMILRFIPKFNGHQKEVYEARKALNKKTNKVKEGLDVFLITITWALENSIYTANSMNAREYGTKKRTSFNNYKLELRDYMVLIWIAILDIAIVVLFVYDKMWTYYYPVIRINHSLCGYILFGLLCLTPIIIDIGGERWNRLK